MITKKSLTYIICLECSRHFIFEMDAYDHQEETGHRKFNNLDFNQALGYESQDHIQIILQQAIIASLKLLGNKAMNSVIWHLSNNHILLDCNIHIGRFYETLQEIIGPSADSVMENTIQQILANHKVNTGRDLAGQIDSLAANKRPDERLGWLIAQITGEERV